MGRHRINLTTTTPNNILHKQIYNTSALTNYHESSIGRKECYVWLIVIWGRNRNLNKIMIFNQIQEFRHVR